MPQHESEKRIYDISVSIRPAMPTWPGDPGFNRTLVHSIEGGASSDVSEIRMGSHTGTHVDAPAHFISGGATIDKLPLDILVGEAAVFELDVQGQIIQADLEFLDITGEVLVLFKTRNSSLWKRDEFTDDFVSFSPEAARYLVDQGIKLVGIDYLSVGEYQKGTEVHRVFLENGVVVVEGLDLSNVKAGRYEMMCLPLKILDAEGSPARVLLREL